MVNLALPGGRLVRILIIERRMKRWAHSLPESSVRMRTLAASGNSNAKGRVRESPNSLVKSDPA